MSYSPSSSPGDDEEPPSLEEEDEEEEEGDPPGREKGESIITTIWGAESKREYIIRTVVRTRKIRRMFKLLSL